MLKQQEIQAGMKPFDHIVCPVCGGAEFTELVPAGGVWCDECNAEFSCRDTAGDPGLVIDCEIKSVWRCRNADYHAVLFELTRRHMKQGHGNWHYEVVADSLAELERLWQTRRWPDQLPISFYQVCKEPQPDGSWTDCRSWNITSTVPAIKLFASIGPGTKPPKKRKSPA